MAKLTKLYRNWKENDINWNNYKYKLYDRKITMQAKRKRIKSESQRLVQGLVRSWIPVFVIINYSTK